MRVLLCNKFFYLRGAGPETWMLKLMKMLEGHGHQVIHFSTQDEKNWPSPYDRFFVSKLDLSGNSHLSLLQKVKAIGRIVYSLEAERKVRALAKLTNPDVAHIHGIFHHLSPSVLLGLKKDKVPVIMTIHDFKLACLNYKMFRNKQPCELCRGHYFWHGVQHRCVRNSLAASLTCALEMYIHRWMNIYQRYVDHFIALSRFARNKLIEYRLCHAGQITWLPTCVETEDIRPSYGRGDYVLYLGGVSEDKGLKTLLRAMERLPDIKLYIAGDGPFREDIQRFAEKRGINNVTFLGLLNRKRVYDVLRESYCLVMPSEWYENTPAAVLEAFAAGKPVIASNIGSLPETVEDKVDGLLFTPGDPKDLSEKIRFLFAHSSLAYGMGRKGREKVEGAYSLQARYEKMIKIYRKAI